MALCNGLSGSEATEYSIWLQIGQRQLQQDVTLRLSFILVDGRNDELDFADLIGVVYERGQFLVIGAALP